MSETTTRLAGGARSRHRDTHFVPKFTVSDQIDLGAEMGAAPAQKLRHRQTRNALLVHLMLTAMDDPSRWTAYPRDHNAYAAIRSYYGREFSYKAVMLAVQTLEAAGLIEQRKARPGLRRLSASSVKETRESGRAKQRTGIRSTIRAARKLLEQMAVLQSVKLTILVSELIRLKNADGQLVRYREDNQTRLLRADVEAQNAALQKLDIVLESPNWIRDELGFYRSGDRRLNAACTQLHLVFNDSWDHGGRWYGGWWQQLPAVDRGRLLINGNPVVELDYRHLHPTLLAAGSGIEWGQVDPYTIDGWPRRDIKLAFNILLNAFSWLAAVGALQEQFKERGYAHPRKRAIETANAVKAAHPQLENHWGTGIGLRLQCVDGMMCAKVQRIMRNLGHPVLSVHDSFIVEASAEALLRKVMDDVLQETKEMLAEHSLHTPFNLLK